MLLSNGSVGAAAAVPSGSAIPLQPVAIVVPPHGRHACALLAPALPLSTQGLSSVESWPGVFVDATRVQCWGMGDMGRLGRSVDEHVGCGGGCSAQGPSLPNVPLSNTWNLVL
eukprot:TRINITY_DN10627_c0_g1_i2.p2 TRINITY_DN10627_c0_g1~~TRINITY_DN10627_c0_g1_i2.p2  ORF type:complete len:113 (-),score=12.36 TRINITY_DN10627_c0_g1_i2:216-554(-)